MLGRHAGTADFLLEAAARPVFSSSMPIENRTALGPSTAVRVSKAVRRRAHDIASEKRFFCPRRYVAGALCALLLLSRSSWSESAPDAKPLTAILLIARGDLPDSNFADSVVLVMNNLGPAPIGIIINRPMPIPVSRLFPDLKRLAKVRDKVYFGGPVDFGSVWFLFRARRAAGARDPSL